MTTETLPEITDEFRARVVAFKKDWYDKYKKISKEKTPQVDGTGKKVIDRRPDGKDYIIDAWISEKLNKHFPGWSSTMAAPLYFLGAEWVVAQVELAIIDEHLTAFGVVPPIRKFYGVDAVRIQYKKDMPHTPENIVDIGDNCQAAVTGAKKRAINRLTGIGDDVYGKRIEEEGAGSYEDIVLATGDASAFGQWIQEHKWPWGSIFEILGVKSMSEITDFKKAIETIKQAKGIK